MRDRQSVFVGCSFALFVVAYFYATAAWGRSGTAMSYILLLAIPSFFAVFFYLGGAVPRHKPYGWVLAGWLIACSALCLSVRQSTLSGEDEFYLKNGEYRPTVWLLPFVSGDVESINRKLTIEVMRPNGDGLRAEFLYLPTESQLREVWNGEIAGPAAITLLSEAGNWLKIYEKVLPPVSQAAPKTDFNDPHLQPSFPGLYMVKVTGYPGS